MHQTVLIVGANRGIGLELARAFAAKQWNVVASVRPQTLIAEDPSIEHIRAVASDLLQIDVTDEKTVIRAAETFGPRPLSLLINVAGVGPEPDNWYEHTADLLMGKFQTNAVGPFLTMKHFHPNLKKASGSVINISSRSASITMCKGDDLAYRMSKAALNMLTVTMAKEYLTNKDNITAIALYPGYVPTRLSSYRSRDNMAECIAGIVQVAERLDISMTGTFVDWRGETVPW